MSYLLALLLCLLTQVQAQGSGSGSGVGLSSGSAEFGSALDLNSDSGSGDASTLLLVELPTATVAVQSATPTPSRGGDFLLPFPSVSELYTSPSSTLAMSSLETTLTGSGSAESEAVFLGPTATSIVTSVSTTPFLRTLSLAVQSTAMLQAPLPSSTLQSPLPSSGSSGTQTSDVLFFVEPTVSMSSFSMTSLSPSPSVVTKRLSPSEAITAETETIVFFMDTSSLLPPESTTLDIEITTSSILSTPFPTFATSLPISVITPMQLSTVFSRITPSQVSTRLSTPTPSQSSAEFPTLILSQSQLSTSTSAAQSTPLPVITPSTVQIPSASLFVDTSIGSSIDVLTDSLLLPLTTSSIRPTRTLTSTGVGVSISTSSFDTFISISTQVLLVPDTTTVDSLQISTNSLILSTTLSSSQAGRSILASSRVASSMTSSLSTPSIMVSTVSIPMSVPPLFTPSFTIQFSLPVNTSSAVNSVVQTSTNTTTFPNSSASLPSLNPTPISSLISTGFGRPSFSSSSLSLTPTEASPVLSSTAVFLLRSTVDVLPMPSATPDAIFPQNSSLPISPAGSASPLPNSTVEASRLSRSTTGVASSSQIDISPLLSSTSISSFLSRSATRFSSRSSAIAITTSLLPSSSTLSTSSTIIASFLPTPSSIQPTPSMTAIPSSTLLLRSSLSTAQSDSNTVSTVSSSSQSTTAPTASSLVASIFSSVSPASILSIITPASSSQPPVQSSMSVQQSQLVASLLPSTSLISSLVVETVTSSSQLAPTSITQSSAATSVRQSTMSAVPTRTTVTEVIPSSSISSSSTLSTTTSSSVAVSSLIPSPTIQPPPTACPSLLAPGATVEGSSLVSIQLALTNAEYQSLLLPGGLCDLEAALTQVFIEGITAARAKRQATQFDADVTSVGELAMGTAPIIFFVANSNDGTPVSASLIVSAFSAGSPQEINSHPVIMGAMIVDSAMTTNPTPVTTESIVVPLVAAVGAVIVLLLLIMFIFFCVFSICCYKKNKIAVHAIERGERTFMTTNDFENFRRVPEPPRGNSVTLSQLARRGSKSSSEASLEARDGADHQLPGMSRDLDERQAAAEPTHDRGELLESVAHFSSPPKPSHGLKMRRHRSVAPSPSSTSSQHSLTPNVLKPKSGEGSWSAQAKRLREEALRLQEEREADELRARRKATLQRMLAGERKRRRAKVAPLSDHSFETSASRRSRKRRWLHRQATNRITPSDEEPRRKHGRSLRGRPLDQPGLHISRRAPQGIAEDAVRELAWMNTGNGVQLMSIKPIAPPTLTSTFAPLSPLQSPSFQQRQLEAYLKIHQDMERLQLDETAAPMPTSSAHPHTVPSQPPVTPLSTLRSPAPVAWQPRYTPVVLAPATMPYPSIQQEPTGQTGQLVWTPPRTTNAQAQMVSPSQLSQARQSPQTGLHNYSYVTSTPAPWADPFHTPIYH